jgi:ATP-binding cassette, subfamily B, multidrug efflux pump
LAYYKWIWQYIKVSKLKVFIGLMLTFFSVSLILINPYISGIIVYEVFQYANYNMIYRLVIIMISITLVSSCLKYILRVIFEKISQDVFAQLRKDLLVNIQGQSFDFYDTNKVGEIMAKLTGDLDSIRHFVSHVIYTSFENLLILSMGVIIMFRMNWVIALSLMVFVPILAVTSRKQSKEIHPKLLDAKIKYANLNSFCEENISVHRVVKAFSRESHETNHFKEYNEGYYKAKVEANKVWAKYLPILELSAGSMDVVLLTAGSILIINGNSDIGQLVAIKGYLWAIGGPVRASGLLINDIETFKTSVEKISKLLETEVTIKNKDNCVEVKKLNGKLEFKNVHFNYPHDKERCALKNISFKANPGDVIGIIGAPGSGKSSLVNLISRFYDTTEGEIFLDDINIRDLDLKVIRRDVGLAMQDAFLFSDTVENNIMYGNKNITAAEVVEIAKITNSHDFIQTLEEGYQTVVGERGVGLSGGQKQRIALARALAASPPILVLDDTTSSVDMETEHSIQKNLNDNFKNTTTFIIANRISSVRHADLILILKEGEIIERGSHEELIEDKGYYYDLFKKQYFDINTTSSKKEEGEVNA